MKSAWCRLAPDAIADTRMVYDTNDHTRLIDAIAGP
jgi:hypothetical protein